MSVVAQSTLRWPNGQGPMVLLAPMDGYTDPAFRRFIKHIEPRAVVFSEFLSATTVARKPSLAARMFRIYPDERPVVIQLYGKDPDDFAAAARLAQDCGAAGIDLNMGCPAKKVVAHQHGSALMKDIDLACRIVARVKAAVTVPVSVKTRLGWEDERNLIPFGLRLQEVGLDAMTVHGRTYRMKFEGDAFWPPIYALKEVLTIPVFGNGDVDSGPKAKALVGNLDGVMIGRAAIAEPWVVREVCTHFYEAQPIVAQEIDFSEKAPLWLRFAEMAVEEGPELAGCRRFRKYLLAIHRSLGLSSDLRTLATKVETLDDIRQVLSLFGQSAT